MKYFILCKVYSDEGCIKIISGLVNLGLVVQSIASLTNSLRGHLVKCFTTSLPNTMIFFVEKMKDAFALQKLLTFFSTKNIGIYQIYALEILTKRKPKMSLVLNKWALYGS